MDKGHFKFAEFPRELRNEILRLACTDEGMAGCSLSFVSHAVRLEVKPFKYQSIGLRGEEQLLRFASFLYSYPARERHRIRQENPHLKADYIEVDPLPVRHLVISNIPRNSSVTESPIIMAPSTTPPCKLCITDLIPGRKKKRICLQVEEYNRSCAEAERERRQRREKFLVDSKMIMTRLGRSLYTLEVNLDSYSIPRDPEHYYRYLVFRQLTSLTIGYLVLHQLEENRGLPFGNDTLRYLYLTGSDFPDSPRRLPDDLRSLALGLTHIRIPLDLAEYLEPMQEPRYSRLIRYPDEDRNNQPTLLPADIQRVFIQLLPKPEIEVSSNYNEIVGRYRELSTMDPRVVVLDADDVSVDIRQVVDRYT